MEFEMMYDKAASVDVDNPGSIFMEAASVACLSQKAKDLHFLGCRYNRSFKRWIWSDNKLLNLKVAQEKVAQSEDELIHLKSASLVAHMV